MHIERLTKIADHLEFGQLGHQEFNYRSVNSNKSISYYCGTIEGNLCGTYGCAMGELPFIFPDLWIFDGNYIKLLSSKDNNGYWHDVKSFLNLTDNEGCFLFNPYYSECILPETASRYQVAQHIRKFISYGGIYPKRYRLPKFASKHKTPKQELCTQNAY